MIKIKTKEINKILYTICDKFCFENNCFNCHPFYVYQSLSSQTNRYLFEEINKLNFILKNNGIVI